MTEPSNQPCDRPPLVNHNPLQSLEQHLMQWLLAYGSDLAMPAGVAQPRSAGVAQECVAPAANAAGVPTELVAPISTGENAPHATAPEAMASPSTPTEPAATTPASRATEQTAAQLQPPQSETVTALRALRAEVLDCTKCKLHQNRLNTVFGEGSPEAEVMFIGEAPGAREDESGRPFVGPAGQLLDRILAAAMGLQRSEAFIANINKCRPPGNRAPEADEVAACLPYLQQQVELVRPKVLVCLGRTAAQNLLGSSDSISSMRGKTHEYCGIPVVVTWHPAYLLREPSRKRETWDDIKKVNRLLGRPEVPTPKR